jgi:hypothetical protein
LKKDFERKKPAVGATLIRITRLLDSIVASSALAVDFSTLWSISAAEFSDGHGRTCFNTGRQ